MPSRRLAEKAVERFGLLQVHGFPAPTHVQLPRELAPPKGGERTGNADPETGLAKLAALGELRRAAGRLLVDGNRVRDLLLRAKHLFVEAMVAEADISNGDGQNTPRSCSQDQRLLEMRTSLAVMPEHEHAAPILQRLTECR